MRRIRKVGVAACAVSLLLLGLIIVTKRWGIPFSRAPAPSFLRSSSVWEHPSQFPETPSPRISEWGVYTPHLKSPFTSSIVPPADGEISNAEGTRPHSPGSKGVIKEAAGIKFGRDIDRQAGATTPTVARSFVFANNKGGVGKSTLLFNLVTEYAWKHPEVNVLVVDLSLYADSSTLLLGGTRKEDGIQRGRLLLQRIPKKYCASGLISALLKFATEARLSKSWWPNRFWFKTQSFDFARHCIPLQDNVYLPHAPPNIFLSAGGPELREAISEKNWESACYALRKSMEAEICDPDLGYSPEDKAQGRYRQWAIFFDTDHEIHTPYATLALGSAERLLVPLSLDENDYDRLFVGDIALFPVLERLDNEGFLKAKIDRFVFNRVKSVNNEPFKDPKTGGRLTFHPAQLDLQEMKVIVKDLHSRYLAGMHKVFLDADMVGSSNQRFFQRYVTALRLAGSNAINLSKSKGIALTQLDSTASAHVGKSTLEPLRRNVQDLVEGLESSPSFSKAGAVVDPSSSSSS
mmetsp:Transcript_23903/g.38504  ORF Transcript_23903/g.38504 Transcript_23903/m.38504 type:complete len:520 (+) Transcript_23903:86-1645(+)